MDLPGPASPLADLALVQRDVARARDAAAPSRTAGEGDAERLREVAGQFEALFYNQLLRAMRATIPENGFWGQGEATKIYRQMHDQALAERVARGGNLGIADMIVRQMQPAASGEPAELSLRRPARDGLGPDPRGVAAYRRQARPPLTVAPLDRLHRLAAQVGGATADTLGRWHQELGDAAAASGLDPALVLAVVVRESGGNSQAVSHRGAVGLMQLMPGTAGDLGVTDATDPRQNLHGGARYLAAMLRRYDGDLDLALAAYNAGPGTVDRLGRRVPDYPETQRYVQAVKDLANRLGYGSGTNLDK